MKLSVVTLRTGLFWGVIIILLTKTLSVAPAITVIIALFVGAAIVKYDGVNRIEGFLSAGQKIKSQIKVNTMKSIEPKHQAHQVTLTKSNYDSVLETIFQQGTSSNPFSNVLLTDICDNPRRLSAPPAFDPTVKEKIDKNVKKAIQKMNPTLNVDRRLFANRADIHPFDASNRHFYSVANTRVSNDLGAFGQYLYGDMPSGKESNARGALLRDRNSTRHTLR